MPAEPQPPDHIRVGDGERDSVAAVLREAAADGRLSYAELDERLDAALRARTYGDLRPLVADLSGGAVSSPSAPVPAPVQGPPPAGSSREDPLRLDGGMSSEKRNGVWTVPPFIRINQGLGSVKLNCLQARAAAPVIEIEIVPGAGSVLLVLRDGWGVDADRVGKTWGSKSIKVPREPAPGQPLLVLHGSVGLGSLRARPANRFERRALRS